MVICLSFWARSLLLFNVCRVFVDSFIRQELDHGKSECSHLLLCYFTVVSLFKKGGILLSHTMVP